MEELDLLAKYIEDHKNSAFFDPPATEQEIEELEQTMGRKVPSSLRTFLLRFNGGFICPDGNSDDADWNFEIAKWNSVRILSVSAIAEAFSELKNQIQITDPDSKKIFIPCILGPNEEVLVFDHPKKEDAEPRILDAFHECGPEDWDAVFKSFSAFLKKYVKNKGDVETIA